MATEAVNIASLVGHPGLSLDSQEPQWFAAYTCAQHEKRVAQQLEVRGVTHYLPLYETVRRWKDRRKRVQLPLFPGYVFVRIPLRNRLDVLRIPSVVRLVGFNSRPTPLDEVEVQSLRCALADGVRAEPHPYLRVGRRARITAGALAGREGILVSWRGNLRVVLSTELLHRSIMLEIDALDVEPIDNCLTIS